MATTSSAASEAKTSTTKTKSNYVISNPSKLLSRHFKSIGIDDVFLSPPPHPLLSSYLSPSSQESFSSTSSFVSWEFVGTVKSKPEDFIVREVFPPNRSIPGLAPILSSSNEEGKEEAGNQEKDPMSLLRVANLLNEKTLPIQKFVAKDNHDDDGKNQEGKDDDTKLLPRLLSPAITAGADAQNSPAQVDELVAATTPLEDITSFLKTVTSTATNTQENAESSSEAAPTTTAVEHLLLSIKNLHIDAFERIKVATTESSSAEKAQCVWVPSSEDKILRGTFHKAFKLEFPLLVAQNVNQWSKDEGTPPPDSTNAQYMKLVLDTKYFELIPFLLHPQEDLIHLYTFEKRGYEEDNNNGNNNKHHSKSNNKKRGRNFDRNIDHSNTRHKAILRLKPGLSKDERRSIHRIITRNKYFGTSTINDIPLGDDERGKDGDCDEIAKKKARVQPLEANDDANKTEDSSKQDETAATTTRTTAIVVVWQKHMFKSRNKSKNIKRGNNYQGGPDQQYSNLLCVLKKRQKEHLSALQAVQRCIRCRPSDIGIAGIKDMYAVTYQFCTIRNMKLHRAKQANRQLQKQGIQLGNVYQVDWMLNNGDLEGNQFEILLRDVQRVYVGPSSSTPAREDNTAQSAMTEKLIRCDFGHVEQMTQRIQSSGFINFYGEQRLGTAGDISEIGIRSFDVGRAMLQQRYADAIDFLMTGRLICRGENEREGYDVIRVRKKWKDSGGDATETLKAFYGNDKILTREKAVLKGLQRYGKDQPLEALRCLSHSSRVFYINAYQSLVWNTVASERIKKFGNQVVKGDLYLDGVDSGRSDIKVVRSDDDVQNVNLSKVVLPMPGHDVQYPENELGDYYKQLLDKDNVTFEKDAVVESTAKGSYRRVVVYPSNMKAADDDGDTNANNIRVSFQLPKGSYATMLLRELMITTATR